jgi:hypothetical protein
MENGACSNTPDHAARSRLPRPSKGATNPIRHGCAGVNYSRIAANPSSSVARISSKLKMNVMACMK